MVHRCMLIIIKNKNTYLIVVAGESPDITVCLFGAASLSFCWPPSVPSPHFVGLQSYYCQDSPSSQKPSDRLRGREEEVGVAGWLDGLGAGREEGGRVVMRRKINQS